MRARISLIISEELLAKVDVIAGEPKRRSTIIELAVKEYIAREEAKGVNTSKIETVIAKAK